MTRPIKSEDAVINFTVEDEQGEIEAPDEHLGQIEGEVELPDPEKDQEEEYFVGAGRGVADTFEGQTAFEGGTIPIKPVDGKPIALLLGAEEHNDGEHVLTLEEEGPPVSMSLGVDYQGSFSRVFTGTVAGSGEINVDNSEELTVDLDVDALGVELDYEDFEPNTDVPDRPVWSFKTTKSNLTIFGKEIARLQDFALEINQNTSIEYYVTSESDGEPFEILYGRPQLTLNATVVVTDSDIYEELVDSDTAFSTSIAFEKDDAELEIELDKCSIRSAPHGVPEEGSVEVDVELVAEDITITVQDDESDGSYL